jgi:hypothetical protein
VRFRRGHHAGAIAAYADISQPEGDVMTLRALAGGTAAALVSLALTAAPTWAQSQQARPQSGEVVATAQPGTGAPTSAAPAAPGAVNEDLSDQDETDDRGPVRDRKVHGVVSVGVGTGGYREVSGAVTGPIGDNGQVTVAIDAGQINGRRR